MTCNYSINSYCEYALKCFNPQDTIFNGKTPELTKRMSGENLATFRFPFHFIEQSSMHFPIRLDRHVYFMYSKNSHFSTSRYTAFPLTRLRHTMHILGVRLLNTQKPNNQELKIGYNVCSKIPDILCVL